MELTKLEQRILNLTKQGDVLTIENLYKLNKVLKFAAEGTIKESAFNMVKKGLLIRLKRGRYLVVKAPENYDPLLVANYLFDGYIAISSALFVYGYDQTRSFVIWGTTSSRKRIRKIREYTYISLPMGKLTSGFTYHDGYKVSTVAKTVFDCVYNLHYLDDLKPLFDMIREMDEKDFDEMISYVDLAENSSFAQRIGFVLEKAGAPKYVSSELQRRAGNSAAKLDKKAKEYINYNKKWSVFDNINIARFLDQNGR